MVYRCARIYPGEIELTLCMNDAQIWKLYSEWELVSEFAHASTTLRPTDKEWRCGRSVGDPGFNPSRSRVILTIRNLSQLIICIEILQSAPRAVSYNHDCT
jgi:hypothetical protein